jgi:FkbM family methyltransferase
MTVDASRDARLRRLLAETPEAARRRALGEADHLTGGRPIVVHGCGNMGRRLLGALRADGIEPLAFSDNSASRWGTVVDGLEVLPAGEACRRHGGRAAFVVAMWSPGVGYLAIREQLLAAGAEIVVPLPAFMWKYAEAMTPHFLFATPDVLLARADEIAAAYQLWADDRSRDEFLGHLEWRLTADYTCLPALSTHAQYFAPGVIELSDTESFVDCGAYDGDTLREFISRCDGRFDAFHAFEPDPDNFAKLTAYRDSLPAEIAARVNLQQAAVSDCEGTLRFGATGGSDARATDGGEIEVPCVRLDDAVKTATYIKMDIEGGEAAALRGAERLIAECSPRLAVCIYHLPQDIFELPLLMRRLAPYADFHCRSYVTDGLDFVAYAVPRRTGSA